MKLAKHIKGNKYAVCGLHNGHCIDSPLVGVVLIQREDSMIVAYCKNNSYTEVKSYKDIDWDWIRKGFCPKKS